MHEFTYPWESTGFLRPQQPVQTISLGIRFCERSTLSGIPTSANRTIDSQMRGLGCDRLVASRVHAGHRHKTHGGSSMKNVMRCLAILAAIGLVAGSALADQSYRITLSTVSKIGNIEFKPGEYKLVIDTPKVSLTNLNSGKAVELEAKVKTLKRKPTTRRSTRQRSTESLRSAKSASEGVRRGLHSINVQTDGLPSPGHAIGPNGFRRTFRSSGPVKAFSVCGRKAATAGKVLINSRCNFPNMAWPLFPVRKTFRDRNLFPLARSGGGLSSGCTGAFRSC